ncbi:MAG TPA: hypothetical protein VM933_04450 [Acidimicrobiales bacterium]|nr:hypothetical protein [Acidimicrobiales bacterium]
MAAPPEDEHRDELPEDLDASGYVGPYTFPDNKRRRAPGVLYAVVGLALVALVTARGSDGVLVNRGLLVTGVALLAIGAYHGLAGHPLRVDQTDALAAAGREVGFAVGHASAQLGWRGGRSRPTWRLLLYSAEDPPAQRGLVLVDGVDGTVVAHFVEANPEDWSEFTADERAGRRPAT